MNAQPFVLPQTAEKPQYVQQLFSRVAGYYDLMNDFMSAGLHRRWKQQACQWLNLQSGQSVLDVCCGTGDLELMLAKQTPGIQVTGLDFCQPMLDLAQDRLTQAGVHATLVQGDALALPFEANQFDGAIISYGLRNVADYQQCLTEMVRVLKPGGRLVILDMSHPEPWMNGLSQVYRFHVMPWMGRLVANDPDAYRYLSNSIYFYLTQVQLADLMQQVGLTQVRYENRMGGICAIHEGVKPD